MNAFDEREHRAAQEALPWLVNGSLESAEAQRLQTHLRGCARCRDDFDLLRAVHDAGPGPAPACDPDRAFARLLPRLDSPEDAATAAAVPPALSSAPSTSVPERLRARRAANDRGWLRYAAALQACLIAVLALMLVRPGQPEGGDGAFRALGAAGSAVSATTAASGIVVMFRPETPERELRRIVRDSGGHLAGGPTVADAWLVDGADPAAVLARLRAEPAVVLAEPLGVEGRP